MAVNHTMRESFVLTFLEDIENLYKNSLPDGVFDLMCSKVETVVYNSFGEMFNSNENIFLTEVEQNEFVNHLLLVVLSFLFEDFTDGKLRDVSSLEFDRVVDLFVLQCPFDISDDEKNFLCGRAEFVNLFNYILNLKTWLEGFNYDNGVAFNSEVVIRKLRLKLSSLFLESNGVIERSFLSVSYGKNIDVA